MKKMKTNPAIKINETITKAQFLALCSKDTNAFRSDYKRPPLPTGSVVVAKYTNIGGVPHKMVNGVLVPLTKKVA